jgi:hypothetical protein
MNMFRNGRWAAVKGESGGAAFVHLLRAATIAAVASSCAAMQDQSDPDAGDAAMSPGSGEDYPPPPPEVKLLAEVDRGRFQEFLSKEGYEDVQFLTLVYTDPEEGEKLTSLKLQGSEVSQPEEYPPDSFRIPGVDSPDFKAIVLYIASPGDGKSCSVSGGSPYCNF